LFRRYETARLRTVLTLDDLREAQELGEELLARKSRDGKARRSSHKVAAGASVALRDRMWTLLCNRHCELRRVGMWLVMDDVHLHVPALLAHADSKRQAGAQTKTAVAAGPDKTKPADK